MEKAGRESVKSEFELRFETWFETMPFFSQLNDEILEKDEMAAAICHMYHIYIFYTDTVCATFVVIQVIFILLQQYLVCCVF